MGINRIGEVLAHGTSFKKNAFYRKIYSSVNVDYNGKYTGNCKFLDHIRVPRSQIVYVNRSILKNDI